MSWKCTRKGVTHPEGTELVSVKEVPGPWNTGWNPCGADWSELEGNVLGIIEWTSKGVDLPVRSPILGELPCGISLYWEWDSKAVDRLEFEGSVSIEIGDDTNKGEIACASKAALEARTFIRGTLHRLRGAVPVRRPGPVSDWVLAHRAKGSSFNEIADVLWRDWIEKLRVHRSAGPNEPFETSNGLIGRRVNPDRELRNKVLGQLLNVFGDNAKGEVTAQGWLKLLDRKVDSEGDDLTQKQLAELAEALQECVRPARGS